MLHLNQRIGTGYVEVMLAQYEVDVYDEGETQSHRYRFCVVTWSVLLELN